MRLGYGWIEMRPNNAGMICRVCMESMELGDVFCSFDATGATARFNAHRHCLKAWLEYSYDVIPMTVSERAMDPNSTNRVDTTRSEREFLLYRQDLLEKYGLA